jgi:F0F1-type ATP synthase delta subunit
METFYAQALWTASQKKGADAKKIVAQLSSRLKEQGRLKLLPGILRELKRIEARNAKLGSLVEVAHEKDSTQALKAAASYGIHADKVHVNASLIKGWRASANGKLVDVSAKRELIDLYRKITTS